MVFRRKLPFFTPSNQPVNHREITTKSPLNYHWIPWNQVLRESPEAALALLRGCTTERMFCPLFLGGRGQGVFSRWFDLWENIGIHGILMGFWWDFHGTWWDFDGLSWDFIIRILARASDYVNSSKFGIWSLKRTLTVNWDFNKKKLANSPTNGDNKLGEDSFFGSLLRICLSWFQQQEKPVLSFK